MDQTEAIERAEREFTSISDKVKRGGNHETEYAARYQRLVQLGVRPQLRKRYR